MSQSGTTHSGPGGGAGKVNVQDLSFVHYVDKASANLMKMCCNGKHFEEATLVVRKAGEMPLEYMIITMKGGLISSVSTGGSGGEDRITENITLNLKDLGWNSTIGDFIRENKITDLIPGRVTNQNGKHYKM